MAACIPCLYLQEAEYGKLYESSMRQACLKLVDIFEEMEEEIACSALEVAYAVCWRLSMQCARGGCMLSAGGCMLEVEHAVCSRR